MVRLAPTPTRLAPFMSRAPRMTRKASCDRHGTAFHSRPPPRMACRPLSPGPPPSRGRHGRRILRAPPPAATTARRAATVAAAWHGCRTSLRRSWGHGALPPVPRDPSPRDRRSACWPRAIHQHCCRVAARGDRSAHRQRAPLGGRLRHDWIRAPFWLGALDGHSPDGRGDDSPFLF
jgi:hypothetical protein